MLLHYNYAKKPIFALSNKALFCKMYLARNRLILKKYLERTEKANSLL